MVWQVLNGHKSRSYDPPIFSSPLQSPTMRMPSPNGSSIKITYFDNNKSSKKKPPPPESQPPLQPSTPPLQSSTRSFSRHGAGGSSGSATLPPNNLPFSMTAAGRFFTQFFDESMRYFDYPMHDIAWSDQPSITSACSGNSMNERIIDDDEKFSIEINLSDFVLEELAVCYDEEAHELLIEGHQMERTDRLDYIDKQFKRKYDVPIDVQDGTLAAYRTSSGLLTVQALKKGVKQPVRQIPIQAVLNVPDLVKNASKVADFQKLKNTVRKLQTDCENESKSKRGEEQLPKIPNLFNVAESISKFQQSEKGEENQLEFKQTQKPTKAEIKREYLNIFC